MRRLPVRIRRRIERGVTAVEVALTLPFALAFLFGIMEVARAMYLWNTLTQINRTYAHILAVTDFNDNSARSAALTKAAFGSTGPTFFPLSGAINASYFQVRYLRADGSTPVTAMPECPPQNIVNCTRDPEGASCIRFVQVRLCAPGGSGSCSPVPYASWLPTFVTGVSLDLLKIPPFSTQVPVDSFGHIPGTSDSCP